MVAKSLIRTYLLYLNYDFLEGGLGNINDALQGSLTYQPAVPTEEMDFVVLQLIRTFNYLLYSIIWMAGWFSDI